MVSIKVTYQFNYISGVYEGANNSSNMIGVKYEDGIFREREPSEDPIRYSIDEDKLHRDWVVEYFYEDTYVPVGQFEEIDSIVYVEIGEGITNIGASAFQGCTNLTRIVLPSTLTSIGNSSFANTPLRMIVSNAPTAPVISLGYSTYYNYATFYSIPDYGILEYPEGSDYSSWLKNFVTDYYNPLRNWGGYNQYAKVKCTYEVKEGDSCFIETFNNSGAFYNVLYNGESIKLLPYSIGTDVKDNVFRACPPIKEFTLEFVVLNKSIATNTFMGMVNLVEVEFPESLTTINEDAFYGSGLRKVTLNKNLSNINERAFRMCQSLETIIVDAENETYDSREGCNCIILTRYNTIKRGSNNSFIPNTVTKIDDSAFANLTGLTEITIPESVTSLGEYAFEYCDNLKKITVLSSTPPTVSSETFKFIGRNGTLYYPSGSDYSLWLRDYGGYYLGYYDWNGVELEPEPDLICTLYVRNTTGSTVICGKMTNVSDVFYNGSSIMNDIIVNTDDCGTYIFPESGEQTLNFVLKDDTVIENRAFYQCDSLTKVVISDTVRTISERAFGYCLYLAEVTIPEGVEIINEMAFYNCTDLASIDIPDSVITIGSNAFGYCKYAKSLVIGSGVTSIGTSAFRDCQNITSITIPDSVTEIGASAFYNCLRVKTIEIGNGVTSIGNLGFWGCSSLTSLVIGENVTSIGSNAFRNGGNLNTITCYATTAPSIINNTFFGAKTGGTLYYPSGSDYSTWLSTEPDYLGYYSWNGVEMGGDVPDEPDEDDSYIKVDVDNIDSPFNYNASSIDVVYNKTSVNNPIVDVDWITITEGYSEDISGQKVVTYTYEVDELKGGSDRTGTITFVGEDSTGKIIQQSITIKQMATSIAVYKFRLEYPQEGGSNYVQVDYTNPTTIGEPYCSQSWVTIQKTQEGTAISNGNTIKQVMYKITMSPTSIPRNINVTFSCTDSNNRIITTNRLMLVQTVEEKPEENTDKIVTVFNVTGSSENVVLCGSVSSFSDIIIDGKSVGLTTTYNLSQGEHTVEYVLKSNRIENIAFYKAKYMTEITIPESVTEMGDEVFSNCYGLEKMTVLSSTPPTVTPETFIYISWDGTLYYPSGSDYSLWLSTEDYYLGQKNWNGVEIGDEPEPERNVVVQPFVENITVNADGTSNSKTIRVGYDNINTLYVPLVVGDFIDIGLGVKLDIISTYQAVYEYPVTYAINKENVERSGNITFLGMGVDGERHSSIVKVVQKGIGIEEPETPDVPENSADVTYSPIWKDVYYTYTENSTYEIWQVLGKTEQLVFKGKVYLPPQQERVNVMINKICQNYFSDDVLLTSGAVGFTHSYKTFKLKNEYGSTLHTYHFVNDWSYKPLTLGIKTNPIIPNIVDGQMLFFSAFATDSKTFKYGMRYYNGEKDYNNVETVADSFSTNIIAKSRQKGVNVFYIEDKQYPMLPKCRCQYVLYYKNPYGGFDWLPILGKVSKTDEIQSYTYTNNYDNNTTEFGLRQYLNEIRTQYVLSTGFLSEAQSARMWEVLESTCVYLHNVVDDKIEPVVIKDTSIPYKKKERGRKMLTYEINVESSQTRERF